MTFRNVSIVRLGYRRSAPALSWDDGFFLWMKDWCCRIILIALFLTMSGCTRAAFMAANLPTYFDNIAIVHDRAYGPELSQKLDVYVPADLRDKPLEVIVFF